MASSIRPLLEDLRTLMSELVVAVRSLDASVKLNTSTIIENQRVNRELVDVLRDQRDELEQLRAQPGRDSRLQALGNNPLLRRRTRVRRETG